MALSRLVAESLKEVEEEQEAMEAVLVRMTSTQSRDKESSPDPLDVRTTPSTIHFRLAVLLCA